MSAKYNLFFDQWGTPFVQAVGVEMAPSGNFTHRQGHGIETLQDLTDLKERFANDATPMALLNGVNIETLAE